jgi:hypothetical protein
MSGDAAQAKGRPMLDPAPTGCERCGMILGVPPAPSRAERERAYEAHLMEHHHLTRAQVQLYRAGLRELRKPPRGSGHPGPV